jgi:hypothetical protein
MAGPYHSVGRQRFHKEFKRLDQLVERASLKVGASDRTHKKSVSGEEISVNQYAAGSRRMPRSVNKFHFEVSERKLFVSLHAHIRRSGGVKTHSSGHHGALESLGHRIVAGVHDQACAGGLSNRVVSARVVGVTVRIDYIAKLYALCIETIDQFVFISGRVDQDAFVRVLIIDKVAKYLHESDRNLFYFHRSLQWNAD